MTSRTAGQENTETPEEIAAFQEEMKRELVEELRAERLDKERRKLERPQVLKATEKMEWLISQRCGASAGAAAVLRYCYWGGSKHTIKYEDLARFDRQNTEMALLLINTVARQSYTLDFDDLGPTGRRLFK
jgi:hypothetical protein